MPSTETHEIKWPRVFRTDGKDREIEEKLLNLFDMFGSVSVTDLYDLFGGGPASHYRPYKGSGWVSMNSFSFEDGILTVQAPGYLEDFKMGESLKTAVGVRLLEGQTRTTFDFDSNNHNWNTTEGYNEHFLKAMVNTFNNQMEIYGYVFLNQILRALGIGGTAYGQIAGWSLNGDAIQMSIEKLVGEDDKIVLNFRNVKVIVLELGD